MLQRTKETYIPLNIGMRKINNLFLSYVMIFFCKLPLICYISASYFVIDTEYFLSQNSYNALAFVFLLLIGIIKPKIICRNSLTT